MLDNTEIIARITEIAEKDGRYKKEAFLLILVALEYTLAKMDVRRHLTGQELAKGISEFAREQYGFMTKMVLESWGIRSTLDFGEIVYLLIDNGLLSKTEEDRKEDFADVYDFDEEFDWKNLRLKDMPERF